VFFTVCMCSLIGSLLRVCVLYCVYVYVFTHWFFTACMCMCSLIGSLLRVCVCFSYKANFRRMVLFTLADLVLMHIN